MKRTGLLLTLLTAAVLLSAAGTRTDAIGIPTGPFPAMRFGLKDGIGNGSAAATYFQGWYLGKTAWYVFFGSNDIDTNRQHLGAIYPTLFPKLGSALGGGANPVYVVLNYQQGPVFSSRPDNPEYSALWQVIYIKWKDGVTPRPVISHLDLPTAVEADFITTDIVVDETIFAIGPLSFPWYPAAPGNYRLKQVLGLYRPLNLVLLPFWVTYGQDEITKANDFAFVLITDVADPALAALLRANLAPGLNDVDPANTQRFWVFDWTLPPPPPNTQFAILENLPHYEGNFGRLNDNYDFSPIMDLTRLQRTGLPAYAVVKNPTLLQSLLDGGLVTPVGNPVRINCSVFNYFSQFGPPPPP